MVEFRGFDSSVMLFVTGGIPRPIGDFLEVLSQAMLAEIMLVGRLGVAAQGCYAIAAIFKKGTRIGIISVSIRLYR